MCNFQKRNMVEPAAGANQVEGSAAREAPLSGDVLSKAQRGDSWDYTCSTIIYWSNTLLDRTGHVLCKTLLLHRTQHERTIFLWQNTLSKANIKYQMLLTPKKTGIYRMDSQLSVVFCKDKKNLGFLLVFEKSFYFQLWDQTSPVCAQNQPSMHRRSNLSAGDDKC